MINSSLLFDVLVDRTDRGTKRLPDGLLEAYGGDLDFPEPPDDRPYVFTNFVTSLDGMAAFGEESGPEGRLISMYSKDDQWLMGLLRGAADSVLVGMGTLRKEPEHTWTARALKHSDADAIEKWRLSEGRSLNPLQCFVTSTNSLPEAPSALTQNDLEAVIFTTNKEAQSTRQWDPEHVQVVVYDRSGTVDLPKALKHLRQEMGVRHLLCEGGPTLFGQMLDQGLVDECFHAVSPQIVGPDKDNQNRHSLTEWWHWDLQKSPKLELLSLRTGLRDSSHLFLRYRVKQETQ